MSAVDHKQSAGDLVATVDQTKIEARNVLIVDRGHPTAADLAAEISSRADCSVCLLQYASGENPDRSIGGEPYRFVKSLDDVEWLADESVAGIRQAVIICNSEDHRSDAPADLRAVLNALTCSEIDQVLVVTDCRRHFQADTEQWEFLLRESLSSSRVPVRLLRVNHVLSAGSRLTQSLGRWSFLSSWVPARLRSSFLTISELAECVCSPNSRPDGKSYNDNDGFFERWTVLGRNQTWRLVLTQHQSQGAAARMMSNFALVVKWLGPGLLFGAVAGMLFRIRYSGTRFLFSEIRPQSEEELLSLCNRQNTDYAAVCGYNNGVNHFGWTFPEKTIVPTVESGRVIDVDHDTVRVDAGVTLKQCIDVLTRHGKQFHVVPNYSYIGMGTIFFVPVHGSGSDVSTIGDTVVSVKLFDPLHSQIHQVNRGDHLFEEAMYNPGSGYIVLQLVVSIRKRSDYFVKESELSNPASDEVWLLFDDPDTSNIEIRKNRAAADGIRVLKYYTDRKSDDDRMAVPRDSIGRLWDRLEENRVTAFLFHFLVRNLAYHVELFLTEEQFAIFWQHHRELPVSKIQLRFVRHDGMPHSPFGDRDCVSADLFMSRRRSVEFQEFVRHELPTVRLNPGKQSM